MMQVATAEAVVPSTNTQLIAKAIIRAAKANETRPLTLSLTVLHEDFGAPPPDATKPQFAPGNIMSMVQALKEQGWYKPVPLYQDGQLIIPDWPEVAVVLWEMLTREHEGLELLHKQYRLNVAAANQRVSDLFDHFVREALKLPEVAKP